MAVQVKQKDMDRVTWGKSFNAWDDAYMAALNDGDSASAQTMLDDIESRVAGLLAFWQQSLQQPQWYFPATSWAAIGDDESAAIEKWAGGFGTNGERDYSGGYARLLAGERDFADDSDYTLLRANAIHLHELITLTPEAEVTA